MTTAVNQEKNISVARLAGFCYGVKRAVEESIRIKKENPNIAVYILGQLIHNNQVAKELESVGIKTLKEIPEKLDGICIVRTHGASPETIRELQQKGCRLIDLTCPDVKRVQDKAKSLAGEGYKVIIIGKADHPEVMAIKGHADLYSESIIISSKEELEANLEQIKKYKKIGVVVQTTQLLDNFKEILPVLAEHVNELKLYNTICDATFKRQKAAKELADRADLMIVVGSKESANTTHLAEVLKPVKTTLHIENKEELEDYKDLIIKTPKIGVTAGASTPDFVINEVLNKLEEIGENS